MSDYLERTNNGTAFCGSDVDIFGMACLISAIDLHIKTNGQLKASKFHTVKNMLAKVKEYTGLTFKRTEFPQALEVLRNDMNRLKALPRKDN